MKLCCLTIFAVCALHECSVTYRQVLLQVHLHEAFRPSIEITPNEEQKERL